jgi:hypothetical protein
MHARTLSAQLRKILLATMAAGCGGVVDNGDGGNPDDGGTPIDTGIPGCEATGIDAGSICGSKEVQLSGNCPLGDTGSVASVFCHAVCGPQQSVCTYNTSTNILTCGGICVGRMPHGVKLDDSPMKSAGDYLARAAYLEAAASDAFRILARELDSHGAPSSLSRAALRSAEDEVRHARTMGELAAEFGAIAKAPTVSQGEVRPVLDIALENVVEGCVRETFGALVAMWQAEHATDTRVRSAMERIAADEVRHAALGWRILDWTNDMLSQGDRERVAAAMKAAISDIASSTIEVDSEATAVLGLPSAADARALVDRMRRELWD